MYVIVGNLTIDYINGLKRPGGPGYYSGIALALLGEPVTIVGYAGRTYPLEVLKELEMLGINLEMILMEGDPTVFELHYEEGARRVKLISRSPSINMSNLKRLNSKVKGILINPVAGEIPIREIRIAREIAKVMAIDAQGFIRTINEEGEVSYYWSKELIDNISIADIIHADEEEIKFLGSSLEATKKLSKRVRIVSITMGHLGSLLAFNNSIYKVEVPMVYKGDETGAGDVYVAVLMSYLAKGYTPIEAAKFATVAAGLKVKHSLSTIRWYTREEIEELSEQVKVRKIGTI